MANELEKANPALQIARITHSLFSKTVKWAESNLSLRRSFADYRQSLE